MLSEAVDGGGFDHEIVGLGVVVEQAVFAVVTPWGGRVVDAHVLAGLVAHVVAYFLLPRDYALFCLVGSHQVVAGGHQFLVLIYHERRN